MAEHGPENLLCQGRVSLLVGVRKIIAAGRRGSAQCDQQPAVQAERIAHIIEADGVSMLRVDEAHQMAPRREGSHLGMHTRLPRQLRDQMWRDQVAELPQNRKRTASRAGVILLFHPCRMAERKPRPEPFPYPV